MPRWTCPRCDREFGARNQSHTCLPGVAVDQSFAGREWQRPLYDAVLAHIESLGPVHVDAVHVGVFLKRRQKFAELRPQARALSLALVLPRRVESARVTRRMTISPVRIAHVIKLVDAADVDDELREWLTEAYDSAE